MKFKSCKHIEDNLYIAPNEIRSCCQRYFYKGKIRGDAKLVDIGKEENIENIDLKVKRGEMLDDLQNDKIDSCLGCPHIYLKEKKPIANDQIKFLSIEQHSICNLRCTYCSPVYYGGVKTQYSVVDFFQKMEKKGNLESLNGVAWGGGEPTLDKSFKDIMEIITKYLDSDKYHKVFTNSVRYNDTVQKYIDSEKISITTSIDAGSDEIFKKIRGRDKFYNVFQNLKKYAHNKPGRVTIKYIFTDENYKLRELDAFIKNCKEYSLIDCCFQISLNFKKDKIPFNILESIVYLYGSLLSCGVKKIFLDDHIMFRLTALDEKTYKSIKNFCINKNLDILFENNHSDKPLIIFGCGEIAKKMINKSRYLRSNNNFYLVDSSPNKIGDFMNGKKINNPNFIKNKDYGIIISSANTYNEIYMNIKKIQNTSENIINKLVL